jgi:hypothetical protein
MSLVVALLLATTAPSQPVAVPAVPPAPPATQVMVDAVVAYRSQLMLEWLHDLNGPYREARPVVASKRVTAEPRTAAPPGGNTGMGTNVEQWRPLVEAHFGANTDGALRVMDCESGGNPTAYNTSSGASGLFQFLGSTWRRVGGEGDVFDPAENIARAATLSKGGTDWRQWTCQP